MSDVQEDANPRPPSAEAFMRSAVRVLRRHGYEGDALVEYAHRLLSSVGIIVSAEEIRSEMER